MRGGFQSVTASGPAPGNQSRRQIASGLVPRRGRAAPESAQAEFGCVLKPNSVPRLKPRLVSHPAPLLQRRRASPERQRWNAIAQTPLPKRPRQNAASPGRSGGVYFGFRSVFESKFEASKTPLSHGFPGLAAIKPIAKSARVLRVRAGCASQGYGWPEALLHPATGGARSGSRPPSVKKRHWPSRLTRHAPQPWSSKSSKPTASGMGSPLSS